MEMSASKLWEKILKIIKKRVNEVEFNTFFKNVEAEEISDDTLKLICSTNLVKKNMEKYKEQIEEIIEIITDEEMKAVFEVKVQEPVQSSSYRFSENRADRNERINTGLNEKNNIDNFVVGDNSRLAYNACQAVVENEMPVYNPLLIYGGSGLGKTHLIQEMPSLKNILTRRFFIPLRKSFQTLFSRCFRKGKYRNSGIPSEALMYFFWMIYSFSRRFSEKVEELSRKSFFIHSINCRNLENR